MRLTGKLKEKVSNAETMEEKKSIIAEAGMELNDDELESVAGGVAMIKAETNRPITCNKCGLSVLKGPYGVIYDKSGTGYIRHVCPSEEQ